MRGLPPSAVVLPATVLFSRVWMVPAFWIPVPLLLNIQFEICAVALAATNSPTVVLAFAIDSSSVSWPVDRAKPAPSAELAGIEDLHFAARRHRCNAAMERAARESARAGIGVVAVARDEAVLLVSRA